MAAFEKQQEEMRLEIERLLMTQEDHLSLTIEEMLHKQKFAMKDALMPDLPRQFSSTENGPLAYRKLQDTKRPTEITNDNYLRFEHKIRLPKVIDLTKVNVKWSREKQTAEQEEARKAEIAL